jgi:hypothetical protein
MKIAVLCLFLSTLLVACNDSKMGKDFKNMASPEHEKRAKLAADTANIAAMQAALRTFQAEKGRWPETLDELTPGLMDHVPTEEVSQSRVSSKVNDGSGGWFYDSATGVVAPNVAP